MEDCRCGHPKGSADPHPCHRFNRFGGGRCGRPAAQRFYNPTPAPLSGFQLKLQVQETWACEEHWKEFLSVLHPKKG